MTTGMTTSETKARRILVAGDVCLDVVGVPVPPPPKSSGSLSENWRLTGEMRTHFLPGGAMLLAEFIRAEKYADQITQAREAAWKKIEDTPVTSDAAKNKYLLEELNKVRRKAEDDILGPRPKKPGALAPPVTDSLYTYEFLSITERLSRRDIVHSLLTAGFYKTTDGQEEKSKTLRVKENHGYSGSAEGDSELVIEYSAEANLGEIIVLDDTGNQFRKISSQFSNPWPDILKTRAAEFPAKPLIVYKLHRPLPDVSTNDLWEEVSQNHPLNRLVIISIDDLRKTGAPISHGLSWERTALDLVFQLLNEPDFSALKKCPRLVIRLGLDGAILWQGNEDQEKCQALLIYDPQTIEGGFAFALEGEMVGYGSAFTAGLVSDLAGCGVTEMSVLVGDITDDTANEEAKKALANAIQTGLLASRRILELGFGSEREHLEYPGAELFAEAKPGDARFELQDIPIIPGAREADRGGWRLLDQIFEGRSEILHCAVGLVATGREEIKRKDRHATAMDRYASELLRAAPLAKFNHLRTYDRREIEHYRALQALFRDYLQMHPKRPLSVAVFGPPGAGKSFGVKEVAASLKRQRDCKEVKPLTFNLSLYQTPDELAATFHLVRNVVLEGKVPLVFFDEFDSTLGGNALGWLRYFLSPMQDGQFLDRGVPHPVGQSIFVFAGGTFATLGDFSKHRGMEEGEFRAAKGPDFLSRLRATLDIPSLNLPRAWEPQPAFTGESPPGDSFNPYGPIDAFPSEAAILLRRAAILSFNLKEKAPSLVSSDDALAIDDRVLRALLRLRSLKHGNRSFEALLDMSHLAGADNFTTSLLPAPFHTSLHAEPLELEILVSTVYPYTHEKDGITQKEIEVIAEEIHQHYLEQRREDGTYNIDEPSHKEWAELPANFKHSNREQAEDIPQKLVELGLRIRKRQSAAGAILQDEFPLSPEELEASARREHDRWVAEKRSKGYICGRERNNTLRTHPSILPWRYLSDAEKEKDLDAIRAIPRYLGAAGYEVSRL